ncbi:flagellar hook-basal body complex protein FliE [Halopseudomonas salegens]|uniref:flagellar hook-basal body complex protein FliE n=1 Tax=Halopseudomonas salegens TaxID=1434072 RepID=UPI000B85C714|nr:flagellar hook-basal body complex protein FliE [Halopseudomonas salegens]
MSQGVEFNRLMMQMRAMQMEATGKPQAPAALEQGPDKGSEFSEVMRGALDKVNELQKTTGDLRTSYEMGEAGVDLTDVMIASQKSSVAMQATVQVRNRMVSAYEEIMRMQI